MTETGLHGRSIVELILLRTMARTEFGKCIISPCKPYDGNNAGAVSLRRADGQESGIDCGGNEARAEIVGWAVANLPELIDEYLWLWREYSEETSTAPAQSLPE